MYNKSLRKYLIILLVIIECVSLSLAFKTFFYKKIDSVKEEYIVDKKSFAMFIKEGDDWIEYNSNTFPNSKIYKLNKEKTSCVDVNGKIINDILRYGNGKLTVTSNKTIYCYLHFDKIENIGDYIIHNPGIGLNLEVKGDMYRYQGTDVDNYICFGTTNKSECINNPDRYMYRIIGVDTETKELKLIKMRDIGYYFFGPDETVSWAESDLYNDVNNNAFLKNTTYVPLGWQTRISNRDWSYNILSEDDLVNGDGGSIYELEAKNSLTVNAKIGLMYVSDYFYTSDINEHCYINGCTTWMTGISEYTMTAYDYSAWGINNGDIYSWGNIEGANVRPVFYLNADEMYNGGSGTSSDPYILEDLPSIGKYLLKNNKKIANLNDNLDDGLYRYQGTYDIVNDNYICFGTNDVNKCLNDTDKYMYRIIGVNENKQLKLIKNEALNSTMLWHTDTNSDVIWTGSNVYLSLNGSNFLDNTTYVPNGWSNKIATATWKYGDATGFSYSGPNMYKVENSWSKTQNAKIGVMYLSDYFYAYQSVGNISDPGLAWIHLSHCDSSAPIGGEWTMYRYGYHSTYANYRAFAIHSSGGISYPQLNSYYSVRPVFYLNSTEIYNGGTGTTTDPYILIPPTTTEEEQEPETLETCEDGFEKCLIKHPSTGLNVTTSYGGMYRYIGSTANNYVSLGGVLYRIIGITSVDNPDLELESGQLKLIKAESIGSYDMGPNASTTYWENSNMYTYLQSDDVLGNASVIPSNWINRVDSVYWYVGEVPTLSDAYTIYGYESLLPSSNKSKIGLMYYSDYSFAYNDSQNCNNSPYCLSWLTDTQKNTWTMTYYGYSNSEYWAFYALTSGRGGIAGLNTNYAVRPTIYLLPDVTYSDGTGTSTDPFILE